MKNIEFVNLGVEDFDDIFAIEQSAFPMPWSKAELFSCFQAQYSILGLKQENRVIAYAILTLIPPEAELLSIAVAPKLQNQGLGQYFLRQIIDWVKLHKCTQIFLEVRTNNIHAINLYQRYGFEKIGMRKKYYSNPDGSHTDAMVMRCELRDGSGLSLCKGRCLSAKR